MKTRLSILVAVLCFLAYYSHTDGIAASNQFQSSELSASKQRPPSNIFDPLGLVSASQQGQLVTLGAGFSFTEGPAVDRHGNVFFTDQPNDRIYRWDAGTGEITLFLEGTGRANGLAFDSEGNLIACGEAMACRWMNWEMST
jgi:gluconolactonase